MAFGGGAAVVPGVRAAAGKAVDKAVSSHAVAPGVSAAAGKAVSSQSSPGTRIFRHHWSIATGYVFDGARAAFLARTDVPTRLFSSDTASCVWCSRFTTALWEACMLSLIHI